MVLGCRMDEDLLIKITTQWRFIASGTVVDLGSHGVTSLTPIQLALVRDAWRDR